jgi:hypothetical protein
MLNPEIRKARKRTWKIRQLEKDTQLRSGNKDKFLNVLIHNIIPRKYLFSVGKFKIYKADGEWIRNNLYAWFRIGGHGRVHLFIPNDEIWIEDTGDIEYNARTIIHELHEFKMMSKLSFYHSHLSALAEELRNPRKLAKITKLLKEKEIR